MSGAATKMFTVEQANRMLPLVRRIVRDIVDAHRAWTRAVQSFEAAATWTRADSPSSQLGRARSRGQAAGGGDRGIPWRAARARRRVQGIRAGARGLSRRA